MPRQSLAERQKRTEAAERQQVKERIDRRQEAIDAMKAPLRRKLRQMEKRAVDSREANLRYYYQLGQDVNEIRNDPDKYGENAMALLEAALFTTRRQLNKCAQFAELYQEQHLEEVIAAKREDSDFAIHWGHMSVLMARGTWAERRRWMNKALQMMWSPEQLQTAIVREEGHATEQPHGRKHELPKTLSGKVSQIKTESQRWLAKQQTAWNGDKLNAFNDILTAAPDEYTTDMVEDLRITRATMEGMAEQATANLARLDQMIQHMENAMEEQERVNAAAEAAAGGNREARSIELDQPTRRRRRAS